MHKVRAVQVLHDRTVELTFTDGTQRTLDLSQLMWGPVFDHIRSDDAAFRAVYVVRGTLAWPGDVDLDTEVLYGTHEPARPQNVGV